MHNRPRERERLIVLLSSGANVQMLAPRRIGKTWLLNKLADDLREQGWVVIEADVEGRMDKEQFLKELCSQTESVQTETNQIFSRLKTRLTKFLKTDWGDSPLDAIGKMNEEDFLEQLISTLDEGDQKCAILIDEVAFFVSELAQTAPEEAKGFLYSLRRLRQKYKNVVWVYTGSVGLDVVARGHGLAGSLVDMEIFELDPFNAEEALSYMRSLCDEGLVFEPFDLSEEVFTELSIKLGWLAPYYLKIIARIMIATGPLNSETSRRSVTEENIEQVFLKLLTPAYRTHFAVWEEHVEKNFPDQVSNRLKKLLNIACQTHQGATEDVLLSEVSKLEAEYKNRELKDDLSALANAGMMYKDDTNWKFKSGLVRRYWLEYWAE